MGLNIISLVLFGLIVLMLILYAKNQPQSVKCNKRAIRLWRNVEVVSIIIIAVSILQLFIDWKQNIPEDNISVPCISVAFVLYLFARQSECRPRKRR